MEVKSVNDFSKEELLVVKSFIENSNNFDNALMEIDKLIKDKDKKENNMNSNLTIELMEKLHFFDRETFYILKMHNIKSIQDLIDSDLSDWNLTSQRRLELEEAKIWYDFSNIEENIEKVNKKRK